MATRSLDETLALLLPEDDDEATRSMHRASILSRADKMAGMGIVASMSGQSLEPYGLAPEFAELPTAALGPLLQEMMIGRALANIKEAQNLKPVERSSRPLREVLQLQLPNADSSSEADGSSKMVALLLIARFREDISWLSKLPKRVGYLVIQKDALSSDLPDACQTLVANVGRESHSYCFALERLLRDRDAVALPPLIVCAQGDPFDHNAEFLDDLATLVTLAAAGEGSSSSSSSSSSSVPLWTPLGKWSGGERLIYSDASGAPHQSLYLPMAKTWRALFAAEEDDASLRRTMPLWLGFTPGACFALSRELLLKRPETLLLRLRAALSPACALCERSDPIAGHAFERLWMYLFLDEAEVEACRARFSG